MRLGAGLRVLLLVGSWLAAAAVAKPVAAVAVVADGKPLPAVPADCGHKVHIPLQPACLPADILLADVQHDPSHLRSYLLQEEEGEEQGQGQRQGEGQGAKKGQAQGQGAVLFGLLIHSLLDGGDSGLQEQVLEMLKMLLDPDTLEGSAGGWAAWLVGRLIGRAGGWCC